MPLHGLLGRLNKLVWVVLRIICDLFIQHTVLEHRAPRPVLGTWNISDNRTELSAVVTAAPSLWGR